MASRDMARESLAGDTAEWSALAAEWSRLAQDWDRHAASWSARAARWHGSDACTGHAVEQANWASARARDVAAWVRLAARELLTLTTPS